MTWTLSAFADEAGQPAEDQIAASRRAGLRFIDLRNVGDYNITELPEDEATAVAAKLNDAGIAVNMFGSPIGKIDIADPVDIDLAKLDHLAKMRDIFGCNAVRIFSYYNNTNKVGMPQWQDEALSRLEKLRARAESLDLVLYHENEGGIFGDHLDQVKSIADRLRDGRRLLLIFDFDNYNRGGDDVWANWQALREQTDAFHLKDSDASGQHVPIGHGAGRAREILSDALEMGWSGPLSLEPHLRHSAAVLATHVSGRENESFKDLSAADCFHLAAETAQKLLREIGAEFR